VGIYQVMRLYVTLCRAQRGGVGQLATTGERPNWELGKPHRVNRQVLHAPSWTMKSIHQSTVPHFPFIHVTLHLYLA
jgi:hypothetical protein